MTEKKQRYALKLSGDVTYQVNGLLVVEGPPNATRQQLMCVLFDQSDMSLATWEDGAIPNYDSVEIESWALTTDPVSGVERWYSEPLANNLDGDYVVIDRTTGSHVYSAQDSMAAAVIVELLNAAEARTVG